MTWVKILILYTIFAKMKTETIECMRCVGGNYELTNLFLASSKLQRKLDRLDETAKECDCFGPKITMEPCDGYCVNAVLLDERERNTEGQVHVTGMIAGCSTDLIPTMKPRKPVVTGDNALASGFSVVDGTHEYTFKIIKKEKKESKKETKKREEAREKQRIAREKLRYEYQLNDHEAQIAIYVCSVLFVVLMVSVLGARYKRHLDQEKVAALNKTNDRSRAKSCQRYQKL